MTKIKEKLVLALKDEDTAKELEKFGLTIDLIEGFEELEKPATLDEAIRNFNLQSDLDKKLDKALKTREDNLKAKYNFVEKEQAEQKQETEAKDPALKALLDKLSAMEKWKEELEQEKQVQTLEQKKAAAVNLLSEHKIPAIYQSRFDLEKPLEEQLEAVTKEYEKDFGAAPRQTGTRLPFPKRGEDKPSKEEVKAIVG